MNPSNQRQQLHKCVGPAVAMILMWISTTAFGASGTWTNDASSVWSDSTSWLNGNIADGTDAVADFSTINISADRTVTLDASHNIGSLLFSGGTGAHNWFFNPSGSSALTLAVSSGTPTIAVTNTATLNVPLAGTGGLTKTGNGTLVLGTNNTYSGATTVSNGTLSQSPASASGSAAVATPVLYMSFDKVIGNTIYNEGSGGLAMNGSLVGAAQIVGGGIFGGNCLSVPAGSSSVGYVQINNPVVPFTASGTWTVALWIKTSTPGAAYLYQGNSSWGGGMMSFYLNNGSGAGTHAGGVSNSHGWEQGSTNIADGNWHYIVMTCDGTTKSMYVDGSVDTVQSSWTSGTGVGNRLWIGGSYDNLNAGEVGLNGLIDEVSVYNRALSQAEVQTLYTAGTLAAGEIAAGSAVSVSAGSTLNLNGRWEQIAGLSGSGTVDSTLAGGTPVLAVNNNTANAAAFSGVINNTAGSLSLIAAGTNSLTLNGTSPSTYTGTTWLTGGGNLIEDFANASSANNLINSSSPLQLGGGVFQVKQKSGTATAQTFAGTTVASGWNKLIATTNGTGGLTVNLGALSVISGTVDFSATNGAALTTTTPNVNGILGGWATTLLNQNNGVGNTSGHWAANDGSGNIITIPYASYTPVSATASSTPTISSATVNQNWLCGSTNNAGNFITTVSTTCTNNSIVVCGDYSISSGVTDVIGSGGIILRGVSRWILNNGAGNTSGTGRLMSGLPTGELYVHTPDSDAAANNWRIWPIIQDAAGAPTTLIKDGPGIVWLANFNTYSGGTIVNGGTLQLSAGGASGAIRNWVTINPGATCLASAANAFGYTSGIEVREANVNGGTLVTSASGDQGYNCTYNLNGGALVSNGGTSSSSAASYWVVAKNTKAANGAAGINALPNSVSSVVSGRVDIRNFSYDPSQTFTVASGKTPNGIDLLVSAAITSATAGGGLGSCGLVKAGPGTMLLTGANTFSGGFTNNAGTTVIGNALAFGTGSVALNGGSISNNTGGTFSVANQVVLAGPANIAVDPTGTLTLSGLVTGGNNLNKVGGGTLRLQNAETYSGNTIVNGGTLALTGSGSIASSPNVNVGAGATFDVSALGSYTLGGGQVLLGSGTNTGSILTTSGTKIYAGTDGTCGTNTFNGSLTLASGAAAYFDLGATAAGSNDLIVVSGNLTNNNNLVHIKAPSTSVSLDQSADYVLFTVAGTISGNLAIAPVWDVAPANSTHYRIETVGNNIILHYDASLTAPSCVGTATPATVTRDQSSIIAVTVTVGTYPISSVTLDASAIGGSTTVSLVQSNSSAVYTNTVAPTPLTTTGIKTLTATVTDSSGFFGATSIPLTVTVGNQVWNGSGADNNWSSNPNWASGAAPAYSGDSVDFGGSVRLSPNMDTNYSVAGLTFDSSAGSFNIGATSGNTLTLTGSGVTNNSANSETLNLPIALASSQNFNAAAGTLTLAGAIANGGNQVIIGGAANTVVSGGISGTGALTQNGGGLLTLSGANTYTGPTTFGGGGATVSGSISNSAAISVTTNLVNVSGAINSATITVNSGAMNVSGIMTNTGLDTVGSAAGNAILSVNGGTVQDIYNGGQPYSSSLVVGNGGGAVGQLQVNSGVLTAKEQIAVGAGSYGAYDQSGGVTTIGGFLALGGNAGGGIWNQNGGTVYLTGGASATVGYAATNTFGVLNLSGNAVFTTINTGGSFAGGVWLGEVGNGSLNVMDNAALVITNDGVALGKGNAGARGTVNLLGGSAAMSFITNGPGAGSFNFEGGTLKANAGGTFTKGTAANTTFLDYAGGAVIDDGGFAVTFTQPIQAPAGYGVANIPITSGGTGYIDTPVVVITNISASGSGAEAIAQIDPVAGTITNILVTCPGQNYGSGDTLGVNLLGGGGSGAIIGTPGLAANVSGGLTKSGAGTLTLGTGNTYAGATRVLAGTLVLSSSTFGITDDLVVSNGTAFVDASTGGGVSVNNLIVLSNANLTLSYGTLGGNPGFTALVASGTITSSGTNVINVAGSGLTLGEFPLISYTGTPLASISNFRLGSLPVGVSASLVNNTANNSIDLNVTLIGQSLTWYGADSGNNLKTAWDINTTADWNTGTLKYLEYATNTFGDFVTFDDTLYNDGVNPQSTNVNLTTTLHPSSIVDNSSLPYSFTGAGNLAGAGAVTMNGSGSLTLGTSNSFTGGIVLNSGTLVLSNASAMGTGPLTISGGSIDSVVPNLANTATNAQNWNGDFTFAGSQSLDLGSGSVTMSANRNLTINAGTLAVGGGISGGSVGLTKSGEGMLLLSGANTYSGLTVVHAGTLAVTGGVMGIPGNSASDIQISPSSADIDGTLTVSAGTVNASRVIIGGDSANDNGGQGAVIQSGGVINSARWFTVGSGSTVTTVSASGSFTMTGGILNQNAATGTQLEVANFTNSAGTVTVSGSSVINLLNNANIALGANAAATNGTFTQNGGTVRFYSDGGTNLGGTGILYLGKAAVLASTNIYNLNGGVLNVPQIQRTTGNAATAIFNFNGGTLVASKPNTTFMFGLTAANVQAGGAVIDTGTNNVTISQALLDGGGGGGLTKNGNGTLTLSGADTYTGPTTINAGGLSVTGAHQAPGALTLAGGASFAVTLSTTSALSSASLTLGSGSTALSFVFGVTNANPALTTGGFTNNGTCTVSISGALAVGVIPLIQYTGAIAGSGSFNPTLITPRGVVAVLSNSVAVSTVYAVVTQTGAGLVWTGSSPVNADLWDINNSTNWLIGSTPTVYLEPVAPGDAVAFTDSGSGAVILNTTVNPSSVVISNNVTSYSFNGSGHIGGTTGLVKNGPGSVTMNLSGNTYTGNTVISNGTYILGSSTTIPTGNSLTIGSTGKVDLNGASPTLANLALGGVVDNSSGIASVLTMGGSSNLVTWNGVITNSGGGGISFIKNGSNTTRIVISTANYLSGAGQSQMNGGSMLITNGGALYMSGAAEFWIAQGAGAVATVIVDGGTLVTSNNWLVVGRAATTANGTLIVNHGTVQKAGANNLVVGSLNATGLLTVNGGQVLNNGNLWLGEGPSGSGTLHLNGGSVQASQIRGNNSGGLPATSAAYFNGGTLQASANSTDFISSPTTPFIQSGGLILDDGGFSINIVTEALQQDPSSLGGGLTKQGSGTVYLDAGNSYTGTTTVSAGTLAGIGSIAGPVVVAPAGNLGAGDAAATGSLNINNNLTIQGMATLRINKTGGTPAQDQVVVSGNVSYGGVLTINNITSDSTPLTTSDTFQLFTVTGTPSGNFSSIVGSPGSGLAYSFNPTTGVLSIVTTIANNPTNILFSVSGSVMTLSWPTDHLGWILQAQTNSLSTGLGVNWVDVAGSGSVTSENITIDQLNPTVYYRLRHP